MHPPDSAPLVQTAWLADHLDHPDMRMVDVRWRARYEAGRGISADDEAGYLAGHIPGAVFAGMVRDLADPQSQVPDRIASPAQFAQVMGRLGIGDNTLVVAYDDMVLPLSAARLWWALSYYGHARVRVLDGGLRRWRAEGRPLSTEVPEPTLATFTPQPKPDWLATKADVVAALDQPDVAIVDCLAPDQYHSTETHPWGDRPGHILTAVNIPYLANADPALATAPTAERDRLLATERVLTYLPTDELAALYAAVGVTPDRAVIAYCGRGFAAASGLLALKLLGYERARLYDGSWAEWSADPSVPVAARQ
ncbi:MAG: sulfurtransferase [Dehalococcoidia bacterium]|nr:sulfurtransferase [Dehalococcoidia bacterium]